MTDKPKKRGGAREGAGRKPAEHKETSFLHLRCSPNEKAEWVKAAQGSGGLTAWAKSVLNKAAEG